MSAIARKARRASRSSYILVSVCLALAATACTVETSTAEPTPPGVPPPLPPGPGAGSLTLQWTIDETADPNLCVAVNAAAFDVVLTTVDGQFAGEFQAGCTALSTSLSALAPGGYYGSALLLDPSGRARTTAVTIHPFNIIENTNLVIDLDFPADSFL